MVQRRRLMFAALTAGAAAAAGVAWWAVSRPLQPAAKPPASTDAVASALGHGQQVVVQFGANVCAACKEMKALLATLQRQHPGRFEVVQIDLIADEHLNYAARYGVQAMPTLVFFDGAGRETSRQLGAMEGADVLKRLGLSSPGAL